MIFGGGDREKCENQKFIEACPVNSGG